MTLSLFLALSALVSVSQAAAPEGALKDRCRPQPAAEKLVYRNDFEWNQSLPQMARKFEEIYASGKRVVARAHWDDERQSYVFPSREGPIRIDPNFLQSVTRHIEIAHERGYAEFLFFPDMGHSHFYLPKKDWPALEPPAKNKVEFTEKLLAHRNLKVLYHTAEQLKVLEDDKTFPSDRWLLWRYHSRNIVGDNAGGENLQVLFAKEGNGYNTVGSVRGHVGGGGFYIGASREGCFPYQVEGKTYYFDFSLEPLAALPTEGDEE